MKQITKSKSQTLFQLKNKESLEKLRLKSQSKQRVLVLSYNKATTKLKTQINEPKLQSIVKQEGKSKQKNIRSRINSAQSKRDKSSSLERNKLQLVEKQSREKQKSKPAGGSKQHKQRKVNFHDHNKKLMNLGGKKQSLKIEKLGDFRTIIPQQGFVLGKQKFKETSKEQNMIISETGVLIQHSEGWEFSSFEDYQSRLKKIEILVNMPLFKNYYKHRAFGKWMRLYKYRRQQNIKKQLTLAPMFAQTNLTLILKQQQLLTKILERSFIQVNSKAQLQITYEKYEIEIFNRIFPHLLELKLKLFEQFLMETLFSLRRVVKKHLNIENELFLVKLPSDEFQDYFMRKSIENHKKSLYKFIMKYQQVKVQILFNLLEEVQKKISFNIQKWKNNFLQLRFIDVIQKQFRFDSLLGYCEIDGSCFVHDTKMPQIVISLTQNQKSNLLEQLKQMSGKFLSNLISKTSTCLKERYQSIFNGEKELDKLVNNIESKGFISERQYKIVKEVLAKINTYCFPQHYKLFKDEIYSKVEFINDLIEQNLQKTIEAVTSIKSEFIKPLEKLAQSQIQYNFQYCSYMQKIMQKLQLMPMKLKMGLFCLDLQDLFAFYIDFAKRMHSMILSQCLAAYNQKVQLVRSEIKEYDKKIQISSWNIKDFIVSYQNSNEYLQFYELKLNGNMGELESILQTIHKLQPRYYEPSYLEYYHLKQDLENMKTKSYSFIREISYKLSYLSSQKGKRYELISHEIDKLQNQMHILADQQKIQFDPIFQQLNQINQKIQTQGQEIEEISVFVEIQKSFTMRQNKLLQFTTYDQLKNQVGFLIKLMLRYREFSELMKSQLQKQYSSFRLQLLVDSISNEIAKIKQTIRFLHQYQKLLLNISGFYQQQNSKIKLLRLVMQLDSEDLVVLDKKNFMTTSKYSASHMLEYLKENEELIRSFIEQKQFTNKLKLKLSTFESKISKFIVLFSFHNNQHTHELNVNTEIGHFIQMLQRCEVQMENYIKNDNLKELKIQIYEFLTTIKRCIRFLTEYLNLTALFATYSVYLKQHGQQNGKPSFNSIFNEQSNELSYIREKWEQLNSDIVQTNLKTIIENKFEMQLQRLEVFEQMIRSQMAKISSYVSKKIEEFPLLGLLSQELLISVLEQPILFLQYYHSSASKVKLIEDQISEAESSSILLTSIYGEKLQISLEKVSSRQLQLEPRSGKYQIDLSVCLEQIRSIIKNNITNLLSLPFDLFIQTIQNQNIPLQAIFVADYINNSLLLQKNSQKQELIAILDKQINQMLNFYKNKETIQQYCKFLIDMLIVSKIQFKYKVKSLLYDEINLVFNYIKVQEQLVLQVYGQSLPLQYHFVDASSFSIIEPINQKTAIKLFQSILQVKNLLLFESSGLQSICVRLMRQLIIVSFDELPVQKAIAIATRQPVLFYFKCENLLQEWQFYQKLQFISDLLNNAVTERQRKIRQKIVSPKQLVFYKPQIFFEIAPCLNDAINRKNRDFYNQLPIELKMNWRIVEYYQPPLLLILKLCLTAEGMQLQDSLQRQLLQQLIKYRNYQYGEFNIKLTYRDVHLLLQEVMKYLIMFQKIEDEHISIIFRLVTTADRQEFVIKKKEKKRNIVFKHTTMAEKSRKSSSSLLKWENTKLSMEFIRFSREMDQILLLQETILVIAKASYGKSYMIKLYTEMVNAQLRAQKQKGNPNCGKLIALEPIDINLLKLDDEWIKKQLKFFQLHVAESSEDKITLFWLQGLAKLSKSKIQELIYKKQMSFLRNIPNKLIVQLNSMSQLSPSTIFSCKQIVFREKAFGFDQIFHNMKEEINYLLAGSCFPKSLDPFTIFAKMMKDFFSTLKAQYSTIFSIVFEEQNLVINSLKLLKGIIKSKSPKLLEHINGLNDTDRCQSLRKLFTFCFLWLSSFIVVEQIQKRYQQFFLDLCRSQQIDVQNVGSAYFLNHKSQLLQYIQIKNAKNNLLKTEQPIIKQPVIFVDTYQTMLIKNLLTYYTCNPSSNIIIFGKSQTGKSALLENFVSKNNKDANFFSYICSIYTQNCLNLFSKQLKEMNSLYDREKVQQMLKEKQTNNKIVWYKQLVKSKRVVVENIAMEMWPNILGYFKFISSQQFSFLDGDRFQLKNMHLLVEKSGFHKDLDEQQHFLQIKIQYDDAYYNEVFSDIYEDVCKSSITNIDVVYEVLKIKSVIIKHLLLLMKILGRKQKQSYKNWTYYYPLTLLKNVFLTMKHKSFKLRIEFIQELLYHTQKQLSMRMKQGSDKSTFLHYFSNCKQHIKEDIREDLQFKQNHIERLRQDEIISKVTNYLQYKNQFKTLKKSKTLIDNLNHFYYALTQKYVIVMNQCVIPGVGSFLSVASEILTIQVVEIASLDQLMIILSEEGQRTIFAKNSDELIYKIPSWLLKNTQILTELSRHLKAFSSSPSNLMGKFRISQILGKSRRRSKFYFVIQYSKTTELLQHNLLKMDQLMKFSSFIQIQNPDQSEITSELIQYLGKQREQLQFMQNSTIDSKICKIYELLKNQDLMQRMKPEIKEYIFSIHNYYRFIKNIIDTYFERKYEIKANLHQIQSLLNKVEALSEQFSDTKNRNVQLKNALSEAKKRLATLQTSQAILTQNLYELQSNKRYLQVKERKERLAEAQKTINKMTNKQQHLVQLIQNNKNIPRSEVAHLKSLYSNNQSYPKQILEILSLLINQGQDAASIKKTMIDINLNMRIRQINFAEQKHELQKLIQQKIAVIMQQNEEYKGFQTLLLYFRYNIQLYFYKIQRKNAIKEYEQLKLKMQQCTEISQFQSQIKAVEKQLNQANLKMEKEMLNYKQIETDFKESQARFNQFSKFTYLERFMQQCKREKQLLEKEYALCLESSIYFSLKLNFIYASDVGVGQNEKITKSKENYECFEKIFDKIFLKWCRDVDKNIQLEFFQKERHKIFDNKEKFYFIDKQLDNDEFDVIFKCKKITEIKYLQQPINQNYSDSIPFFVPNAIFNKCILIKYLLNIKHYFTSILILDRYRTVNKYLLLGNRQKIVLKRSAIKNGNYIKESKDQGSSCSQLQGLVCYYTSQATLINCNYNLLFVEIPKQTSQIVVRQRKRQVNGIQGLFLKINSVQYIVPQLPNLKIMYVLKQPLLDSHIMHQFHLINMEQNLSDCQELIKHEILSHSISKPQYFSPLMACTKSLQNVTFDDNALRKIVSSNQKFKLIMDLQNQQEKYKYYIIQNSGITKIRDKSTTVKDDLLQNITQMLEKWITLSEEYRTLYCCFKAVQLYQERYLNACAQRIIQIYETCVKIKQKLRQKKRYLFTSKESNFSFIHFLRLIRQGLRYIEVNCLFVSLQKQYQMLVKFILAYYCNLDETKELNTYVLFLKIYAIETEQATGYQAMNLLHKINFDNLLETIMEYKSDNITQAIHLGLPVYKLQVEKFLKILKDLRSGKGQGSIMRTRSLTLNPLHIRQLINQFQFKIVKRINNQQDKALQQFKKFPLFTRLLLEKLQTPELFHIDSYQNALNWKSRHLNLNLKAYFSKGINFFFCDMKIWGAFLLHSQFQGVTIVKISEWYYKVEEKLKNISNMEKLLIIDERQFQVEDKASSQNKQKIIEYLLLNRTSLMIVMSTGYEQIFYQALQDNSKEKDKMADVHKLHIYELFQLISKDQSKVKYLQTTAKQQIQSLPLTFQQKWDNLLKKLLNTYSKAAEISVIRGLLQMNKKHCQLEYKHLKGCVSKLGTIIENSFLLWHNYSHFEINQFSNYITGQQVKKKSKLHNAQIAYQTIETVNIGKKLSSFQVLINYLSRKQSITQYLRDKSSSRMIGSSQLTGGRVNRNSNTTDEVQYRFALQSNQNKLLKKASFNTKDFRRVSRVKSHKARCSSLVSRFSVQCNDLEEYLDLKITTEIQRIEQSFEYLIKLCKIYEGQIPFKGGYDSLELGSTHIQRQIKEKYRNILDMLKNFESLIFVKEAKKVEAVYNYQNVALAESCNKNVGILGISYHEMLREENEMMLKCYDSEKCEDCSALVKKKNVEKVCVLLRNQLFELVLSSYIIIKEQEIPTIRVRFQNSVILAKIYCKKVLSELV